MTVAPRPVTPLGILATKLEYLTQQIEASDSVDADLKSQLRQACELASGLDPYINSCTTPESPALAALARRTQAEDWSQRFSDSETVQQLEQEMLSGHIEGQTLKFFVHLTRAKRVLEIGMFTGYSALAMAEALPDDGEVVACELDAYVAEFAQQCFKESDHGHKIRVKVAPALLTLKELAAAGEVFDLVFIDADKAGYVDYLNLLLDTDLLAPNALICADNTLMQGQPYLSGEATANGRAIAKFNQAVAGDPRIEQVLLPLRDGLTLIRRV
ncbi:MAG: SAM-dependent methyltransferase [Oscillatoriales cyanobacterium]|uniref:O-methyltransferase n=1 Tax=unclassified Microcoleus TaxID=2642155 RepID=UPI001DECC5E8|nr:MULTISPECIES: class I SAM-dependent methyltransferase [unclassified Microcoleus]TAE96837.1 MAG: SAM-dependent methyltransferase [Oscillatoriales cyanobacterium]MCC3459837.1 class I SAM-dependent methyltransferase [Microcoleus sp. PH2017_11_PCY_U_A]MCC3478270.1 class I SAM-dependent methyltransferase [Microcoleus sp. PH2017_12_PCY_D_A]MCC3531872.1 class I SAM-dependent methyltransferase [Microcoleus sp. PH2017_21_RUC_O_A]MCC3544205.1 class I SAM-dependent methyltransferase [Microcoleus sp. P